MKFSAVLSLVAAPLALAKALENRYPIRQRTNHLVPGGLVLDDSISIVPGSSLGSTQVIVIWANPGAGAETTTVHEKVTVTQTVTVAPGHATPPPISSGPPAAIPTHEVVVGGDAGLVYSPPSIQAAVGDMVVFTFMSENHTVTQSGFDTPCDKLAGGMNTGFQPNPENTINPPPQVAMQVMTTEPLWFYCAQEGHCGAGMVFSINPTAEKSQELFVQKAIAQEGDPAAGNGNGNGNGTEAPAAPSPVKPPAGIETGTGQIQDGACVCAVQCSAGAFPAAVQGAGAFGGFPGSIPANMAAS